MGSIFVYFDGSGAGPWIPFSTFPENARKRSKTGEEKGAEMDACSFEFQFVPENGKCVSTAPARADCM